MAIDYRELRIGNIVSIPECTINAIITAIGRKGFNIDISEVDLDETDNYFDYNSAYPMPLTPEILEKCGFDKMNGHAPAIGAYDWFDNGKFETVHVYKNWICLKGVDSIPIKYLHQLQNLYYALTGEELNYKP